MPDLHDQLAAYATWVDDRFTPPPPDVAALAGRVPAADLADPPPTGGGRPRWRHHLAVAGAVVLLLGIVVGAALALAEDDDPVVDTGPLAPPSSAATSTTAAPTPPVPPWVDTTRRPEAAPCRPGPYDPPPPGTAAVVDPGEGWGHESTLWNSGGLFGDRSVGDTWRRVDGATLDVVVVEVAPEHFGNWLPDPGTATDVTGRPATVGRDRRGGTADGLPFPERSVVGWVPRIGAPYVVRLTLEPANDAEAVAIAERLDLDAFLDAQSSCPPVEVLEPGERWASWGAEGWWMPPRAEQQLEVLDDLPDGTVLALPVYAAPSPDAEVVRYALGVSTPSGRGGRSRGYLALVAPEQLGTWKDHVDWSRASHLGGPLDPDDFADVPLLAAPDR